MIWLTWRQFRAQAIAASAALAMLAIVLAVTGPHLAHLYDASGIATCRAHGNCGPLATSFLNKLTGIGPVLYFLGIGVLFAVPAIIGVFWGAPLVARELEAGTFRLAWNQSITRTRWLAVKLTLIGLAAMATAGLLSLMITWWASPIDSAAGLKSGNKISLIRLAPALFATRGITPIGYAAFAFALGVTAGIIIRRTIPAMAATLVGFAAVQLAWPSWIRPHLIAPVHTTTALNPASIYNVTLGNNNSMNVLATPTVSKPGAWILSTQAIDKAGNAFHAAITQACLGNNFQACQASLGRFHLRQLITYQPASRYWTFQWYETAIFLALALALAGLCYWRIRRLLT